MVASHVRQAYLLRASQPHLGRGWWIADSLVLGRAGSAFWAADVHNHDAGEAGVPATYLSVLCVTVAVPSRLTARKGGRQGDGTMKQI